MTKAQGKANQPFRNAEKVCFIKSDDPIGPETAGAISRGVDEAKSQRAQRLPDEVGKRLTAKVKTEGPGLITLVPIVAEDGSAPKEL